MGGEYNEQEDGMQTSLVLYDDEKDSFWAVGADRKGASDAMVKFSVGVIDQSGYVGEKVSFKSDQEPSMVALKHHTAASRVGQTVPIESPVRSSKSNGMMENAIQIWQGQLRTIKHHVETRTGACIEPGGVIFSWLIPYCADILNKFRVGADGRTAYERITSHACKVAQVGFGEVVDFKPETDKNNRLKADSEFFEGVFLGYAWRSTEYLVAVGDNIYQCHTIKRRADEICYDWKLFDGIAVRFEDFILKGAKSVVHVNVPKTSGGDRQRDIPTKSAEIIPRRIYIYIYIYIYV